MSSRTFVNRALALSTLLLTLLTVTYAGAKAKPAPQDPLFAGSSLLAHGAEQTTIVNLNKSMIQQMNEMSNGKMKKGMPPWMGNLSWIAVRVYQYKKADSYKLADVLRIAKRFDGNDWLPMVKVIDKKQHVWIYTRQDDDPEQKEMAIIVAQPEQVVLVHLKGLLSMNELSEITKQYSTPALKKRPGN